jgi:hypothetical protein
MLATLRQHGSKLNSLQISPLNCFKHNRTVKMNTSNEYRDHSLCGQCAPLILHEGKLRVEQPEWSQSVKANLGPVFKLEERKSCPTCRLVASYFRAYRDLYTVHPWNGDVSLCWDKSGFYISSMDRYFATIKYILDDIVPQTDRYCSIRSQCNLVKGPQIDVSWVSSGRPISHETRLSVDTNLDIEYYQADS